MGPRRERARDERDLRSPRVTETTKREISQTQRDTGIPAGLPYLTGWIQHHAIEAEMNET